MTNWLIHFTRASATQSAFDVLKSIAVEGLLRPAFAPRGSPPKSTIYGPSPAVCFTEQPLLAFMRYLDARRNSQTVSGYGLVINKRTLLDLGGLPVIYGARVVNELDQTSPDFDPAFRLLGVDTLPLHEQFRYVAFNPSRDGFALDWSHEREWRWPSSAALDYEQGNLYLGTRCYIAASDSIPCRVNVFVQFDADVENLRAHVSEAVANG